LYRWIYRYTPYQPITTGLIRNLFKKPCSGLFVSLSVGLCEAKKPTRFFLLLWKLLNGIKPSLKKML